MTKKQDVPVKKNAFVHKLYSMLNNPKLTHLIWWTNTVENNVFALYPGKEFAHALTGYFKHGNVASFVRQLHMYGFHKVSDPNLSQLDKDAPPIWEFKHSLGKFRKNDESSLVYIKRRSSSNNNNNANSSSQNNSNQQNAPPKDYYDHPTHETYVSYSHPGHLPPGQPVQSILLPPPQVSSTPILHHHAPLNAPMYYDDRKSLSGLPHLSHVQQHSPIPQKESKQGSVVWQSHPVPSVMVPIKQEHTPQFRKVWKESSDTHRPRNPSLLYDPLAPVPTVHSLTPTHPSSLHQYSQQPHQQLQQQQLLYSTQYIPLLSVTPSVTPINFNSNSAPASISGAVRKSSSSTTPLIPSVPTNSVPGDYNKPHSIAGYERDFQIKSLSESRSSIKLPPPSFLPSTIVKQEPNDQGKYSNQVASPPMTRNNSSINRKPSLIPMSNSFHEVLRPSLVDLHYGNRPFSNSSTRSSLNRQNGSIGSTASHNNSIFSNKSSFGSLTSQNRSSSFGSFSNHIPVCPHEEQRLPIPSNPDNQSFKEPRPLSSNQPLLRTYSPPASLTKPQNGSSRSPVQRSSTSLPAPSDNGNIHRSLTASPLTISAPKALREPVDMESSKSTTLRITNLLDNSKVSNIASIMNSDSNHDDTQKEDESKSLKLQ